MQKNPKTPAQLVETAMRMAPKKAIPLLQQAQNLFRQSGAWPEYWHARRLESELFLKFSDDLRTSTRQT